MIMAGKPSYTHTIDELGELLVQIQEKFQWLGDYL
jgi:hypothetical protein